ncbi:conserved hypothetical protein, partial [Trichinella spiralis]|uniref:hypothetical protein n=1 Tax=Trichinella spiralis TaxID=6334 RepID=UPI0001EFEA37
LETVKKIVNYGQLGSNEGAAQGTLAKRLPMENHGSSFQMVVLKQDGIKKKKALWTHPPDMRKLSQKLLDNSMDQKAIDVILKKKELVYANFSSRKLERATSKDGDKEVQW